MAATKKGVISLLAVWQGVAKITLWISYQSMASPARRKELLVRDGVEAFLTRYAKEK